MGFVEWMINRIVPVPALSTDVIWLSEQGMLEGLVKQVRCALQAGTAVLLIAHFPDDLGAAVEIFQQQEIPFRPWDPPRELETAIRELRQTGNHVLMTQARQLPSWSFEGGPERPLLAAMLLICNHHPLVSADQRILRCAHALQIPKVTFLTSLDHPLFQYFSGRKIQDLLRLLGMREDEAIEHPHVDRQVSRAQGRIARQVREPLPAESAEEWFEVNLPPAVSGGPVGE